MLKEYNSAEKAANSVHNNKCLLFYYIFSKHKIVSLFAYCTLHIIQLPAHSFTNYHYPHYTSYGLENGLERWNGLWNALWNLYNLYILLEVLWSKVTCIFNKLQRTSSVDSQQPTFNKLKETQLRPFSVKEANKRCMVCCTQKFHSPLHSPFHSSSPYASPVI